MAVGRTLAGRQARRRDSKQADWQAGGHQQPGPSDANYWIAGLGVWCNTGTENGAQVRVDGGVWKKGGVVRREARKIRAGNRQEESSMSKEEVAVSSCSCWCKKEEKQPLDLLLSVSDAESTATTVNRGRIETSSEVPQKPAGNVTPGIPECWDYSCQSTWSNRTVSLCISATLLKSLFINRHTAHGLKQTNMWRGR